MNAVGSESLPIFVDENGVAKPIDQGLFRIITVTVWKDFTFYTNYETLNPVTGEITPEGGKKSEFHPTNRTTDTEDAIVAGSMPYDRTVYINNIPDGYVPVGIVGINSSAGSAFAWREWHVKKVTVNSQEKYAVRLHGRYIGNQNETTTVFARVLLVKTPWLGQSINGGDPDIVPDEDDHSN